MSAKLLKSTAVTGGMTLLSRITGLARDVVFARMIGASIGVSADAFYVAFRIPNFLRRIFGEGAFSQAFIPVYAEYDTKRGNSEAKEFLSDMVGTLTVLLFIVTLVGVVAAPLLVLILAPGFLNDTGKYDLTVVMLRIMFPYILFISLVAMAAGVLNTHRRFAAPAFTPVLLNLCLISAALWLAPRMAEPVIALAWGVFVAGIVQLLFQLPFLVQIDRLPRPRIALRAMNAGVRRVFRLMVPAIFGVSVAQLNVLINTLLASFLVTGSVSWLYYSDRLMEFPLGVFGIALATVILPSLSRRHAANSTEEFSQLLDWALRWVFIIAVPASLGLIVLAGPLLVTFFYYGAFGERDVIMSARALMAFSIGLVGFVLVKVLAPGFYARQDTKTPMKVGAISMGANIVLSLALIYPLRHVGLALAISMAAFVNAGLLFWLLIRQNVYRPQPGWNLFLTRVLGGSAAMTALLMWGVADLLDWFKADLVWRVSRLLGWVGAGVLTYLVTILILGLRPGQVMLTPPATRTKDE